LTSLIQQHGALVFTDVPGIAAQADAVAPMQVFEHRQLLDSGLWDQRPTLRQLANGQIPLVVLDYLGNWMTPESIALITSRYAQSGSRGSASPLWACTQKLLQKMIEQALLLPIVMIRIMCIVETNHR
jgi:hypothetical protein